MNTQQAREWIEHAPAAKSKAPDLWGFWFGTGGDDTESLETAGGPWYLCADCAARLQARGCSWSSRESSIVWKEQPHIACAVCGKE